MHENRFGPVQTDQFWQNPMTQLVENSVQHMHLLKNNNNNVAVNCEIASWYAPNNILYANSCPQQGKAVDKVDLVPFEICVLDKKSHLHSFVTLYHSHFSSYTTSPLFATIEALPSLPWVVIGEWEQNEGFCLKEKWQMTGQWKKKKLGFFCVVGWEYWAYTLVFDPTNFFLLLYI